MCKFITEVTKRVIFKKEALGNESNYCYRIIITFTFNAGAYKDPSQQTDLLRHRNYYVHVRKSAGKIKVAEPSFTNYCIL